MDVCKAYLEARTTWISWYAELERSYEEAECAEQWERAERIGEALVELEQHSGFKKCLFCGRKDCPAHFDGFVSWEPMDSSCKTLQLTVFN